MGCMGMFSLKINWLQKIESLLFDAPTVCTATCQLHRASIRWATLSLFVYSFARSFVYMRKKQEADGTTQEYSVRFCVSYRSYWLILWLCHCSQSQTALYSILLKLQNQFNFHISFKCVYTAYIAHCVTHIHVHHEDAFAFAHRIGHSNCK